MGFTYWIDLQIWDNDIAESAQKYAEKRVFEHSKTDSGDRFEGAGENLAYRRQKGYEFDRKGVLSVRLLKLSWDSFLESMF